MEKMNQGLNNLEKMLQELHPICRTPKEHEQDLRRILLNSGCFSQKFSERWKERLGLEHISPEFAGAAFFSGIFLAIFVQFVFLGLPKNFSASQKSDSQTVFQTLYDEGRLRLKEEKKDGTRIYVLHLGNSSEVEIHDPSPYRMSFVDAQK